MVLQVIKSAPEFFKAILGASHALTPVATFLEKHADALFVAAEKGEADIRKFLDDVAETGDDATKAALKNPDVLKALKETSDQHRFKIAFNEKLDKDPLFTQTDLNKILRDHNIGSGTPLESRARTTLGDMIDLAHEYTMLPGRGGGPHDLENWTAARRTLEAMEVHGFTKADIDAKAKELWVKRGSPDDLDAGMFDDHMSAVEELSLEAAVRKSPIPGGPASAVPTPPASAVPTPPASAAPTPPASAAPTPPASAVPTPPASAVPTPPVSALPVPPAATATTPADFIADLKQGLIALKVRLAPELFDFFEKHGDELTAAAESGQRDVKKLLEKFAADATVDKSIKKLLKKNEAQLIEAVTDAENFRKFKLEFNETLSTDPGFGSDVLNILLKKHNIKPVSTFESWAKDELRLKKTASERIMSPEARLAEAKAKDLEAKKKTEEAGTTTHTGKKERLLKEADKATQDAKELRCSVDFDKAFEGGEEIDLKTLLATHGIKENSGMASTYRNMLVERAVRAGTPTAEEIAAKAATLPATVADKPAEARRLLAEERNRQAVADIKAERNAAAAEFETREASRLADEKLIEEKIKADEKTRQDDINKKGRLRTYWDMIWEPKNPDLPPYGSPVGPMNLIPAPEASAAATYAKWHTASIGTGAPFRPRSSPQRHIPVQVSRGAYIKPVINYMDELVVDIADKSKKGAVKGDVIKNSTGQDLNTVVGGLRDKIGVLSESLGKGGTRGDAAITAATDSIRTFVATNRSQIDAFKAKVTELLAEVEAQPTANPRYREMGLNVRQKDAMVKWLKDTRQVADDLTDPGEALVKRYETRLRALTETGASPQDIAKEMKAELYEIEKLVGGYRMVSPGNFVSGCEVRASGRTAKGRRDYAWEEIQSHQRHLEDGLYFSAKRTEPNLSQGFSKGTPHNVERFAIEIENFKVKDGETPTQAADRLLGHVTECYSLGVADGALYALRHMIWRGGRSPADMQAIKTALVAKLDGIPSKGKHWDEFANEVKAVASNIPHSDLWLSQRAILKIYTEDTYWFRMARQYPGTAGRIDSWLSTPFYGQFIEKPLTAELIKARAYVTGGMYTYDAENVSVASSWANWRNGFSLVEASKDATRLEKLRNVYSGAPGFLKLTANVIAAPVVVPLYPIVRLAQVPLHMMPSSLKYEVASLAAIFGVGGIVAEELIAEELMMDGKDSDADLASRAIVAPAIYAAQGAYQASKWAGIGLNLIYGRIFGREDGLYPEGLFDFFDPGQLHKFNETWIGDRGTPDSKELIAEMALMKEESEAIDKLIINPELSDDVLISLANRKKFLTDSQIEGDVALTAQETTDKKIDELDATIKIKESEYKNATGTEDQLKPLKTALDTLKDDRKAAVTARKNADNKVEELAEAHIERRGHEDKFMQTCEDITTQTTYIARGDITGPERTKAKYALERLEKTRDGLPLATLPTMAAVTGLKLPGTVLTPAPEAKTNATNTAAAKTNATTTATTTTATTNPAANPTQTAPGTTPGTTHDPKSPEGIKAEKEAAALEAERLANEIFLKAAVREEARLKALLDADPKNAAKKKAYENAVADVKKLTPPVVAVTPVTPPVTTPDPTKPADPAKGASTAGATEPPKDTGPAKTLLGRARETGDEILKRLDLSGNPIKDAGKIASETHHDIIAFTRINQDDNVTRKFEQVSSVIGNSLSGLAKGATNVFKRAAAKDNQEGHAWLGLGGGLAGGLALAIGFSKLSESKWMGKIGTWPFIGPLVKILAFGYFFLAARKGTHALLQGAGDNLPKDNHTNAPVVLTPAQILENAKKSLEDKTKLRTDAEAALEEAGLAAHGSTDPAKLEAVKKAQETLKAAQDAEKIAKAELGKAGEAVRVEKQTALKAEVDKLKIEADAALKTLTDTREKTTDSATLEKLAKAHAALVAKYVDKKQELEIISKPTTDKTEGDEGKGDAGGGDSKKPVTTEKRRDSVGTTPEAEKTGAGAAETEKAKDAEKKDDEKKDPAIEKPRFRVPAPGEFNVDTVTSTQSHGGNLPINRTPILFIDLADRALANNDVLAGLKEMLEETKDRFAVAQGRGLKLPHNEFGDVSMDRMEHMRGADSVQVLLGKDYKPPVPGVNVSNPEITVTV